MATVQDPVKAPKARHERFVQQQLSQATRRVRFLDFATAGLGLVIAALAYGLVMIFVDRWLHLPQLVRQLSLAAFVIAGCAYTWFILMRPFRLSVNPYYAARHVEETLPDAKNSIVNWLDLHDENLPAPVRDAIGRQAAADLEAADVHQAIHSNHVTWLGVVAGGLFVGMLIALAVMRPDQFMSLMNRTFKPFDNGAVAKQTTIVIVTPVNPNAVVPVNQSVTIAVDVDGRVPDAFKPDSLRVLYRHQDDDPWESIDMQMGADPREWSAVLTPSQVQNGFTYKVVGGDDETEVRRVQVRSTPLLTHFDVTYTYRPYLKWFPRESGDPNLDAIRGTQVTMVAHANRPVREARLMYDGDPRPLPGTRVAGEPNAVQFKFVIDKDAKYRIYFTTTEGEANTDPLPYSIRSIPDRPPEVEITSLDGRAEIKIPADGLLKLEGQARDDFGLTSVRLRMKHEKTELAVSPYRDQGALRLENGTYMKQVEYKDFIDLTKLKTPAGAAVQPKVGDEVEFWLEAADNCDYPEPGPNVGSSKHYKFVVTTSRKELEEQAKKPDPNNKNDQPKTDAKEEMKNEREAARQDKEKQDQKFEEQKKQANDEAKKDDAKKEEAFKEQQGQKQDKNGKKEDAWKKDPNGNMPEAKPDDKQNDPNKDQNKNDGQQALQKDKDGKEKLIEDAKKELQRQQQEQERQAKAADKPDMGQDNKPGDKNDPAQAKPMDGQKPGENKQPGGAADPMNQNQQNPNAKPENSNDPKNNPMGGAGDKNNPENKNNVQQNPKDAADGKGNPNVPEGQKEPGAAKDNQGAKPNDPKPGEPKPGEQGEKPGAAKQKPQEDAKAQGDKDKGNVAKDKPKGGEQIEKGAVKPDGDKANDKSKPKGDANGAGQKEAVKAGDKPMPKDDQGNAAQPKPDMGENGGQPDNNAKPGDMGKDDLNKLAERAKNGDQQARQQLEQMAKDGSDPQKQQAAKDALEKSQPKPGDQPAGEKPGDKDGQKAGQNKDAPKDQNAGAKKDDKADAGKAGQQKGNETPKPGEAKQGQKGDEEGAAESKKPGEGQGKSPGEPKTDGGKSDETKGAGQGKGPDGSKPGDGQPKPGEGQPKPGDGRPKPGDGGKKPGEGQQPGQGAGQQGKPGEPQAANKPGEGDGPGKSKDMDDKAGKPGAAPGFGSDKDRDGPAQGNSPEEDRGNITGPKEEFKNRGGDLKLDKIDPKKLKETLDRYKLTEEEFRKHLADEERRLREQAKEKPKDDKKKDLERGNSQGGSFLNRGAEDVKRNPSAKPGDLRTEGGSVAPSEYKDAAEKFSEIIGKKKK